MYPIYPQAEPFFFKGRQAAVLFIHGFTASPSEMYPLAKEMWQRFGYTVSGPLLPGHGSRPQELNLTSWMDWYNAVEQELHFMASNYTRVFVVGLSLGALLALHLGCKAASLSGVVSINAPIITSHPLQTTTAAMLRFVRPYYRKNRTVKDVELERQGRFAYEVMPVKAFLSMMHLRDMVMAEISEMAVPLLVFQASLDESVHPKSGKLIVDKAVNSQSRLVMLDKSYHIATMGEERSFIAEQIHGFIETAGNCCSS